MIAAMMRRIVNLRILILQPLNIPTLTVIRLVMMMMMMMVAATMADQTGGAVMNMEMTDSAHLVARFVVDDIILVVTIIIVKSPKLSA